ncbi:PKD domain-containing protein [Halorussus aquaticus]|uniref:PKD domain-containing protein n=1 Tax=Halorussus aquaticus TaxID=2953748 RepID=A0ABD5PYM3_9EURY|nr:PKD domain-containing protein [Halorussus aquaticus]
MSKWMLVALVVLLVVTPITSGTLSPKDGAPANESPLADAGLDQGVKKGATVMLDGTGSRDPDGRIERYNWSIRTPSDETLAPDCPTCARTRFTPNEVGRYRVTLTVTGDSGATSSDTLYVDVAPGKGPTISLSGPDRPDAGSTVNYTANLDSGAASLEYVVWTADGIVIANHTLSPDQESDTASKHFPTAGERTITATVYDADNRSSTGSISVDVLTDPPDRSPGTNPPIANRSSPTIGGDKIVTGGEPLRGEYAVRLDADTDSINSIQWRNAAGRVGAGRSITRTWKPGDHELYAVVTYTDGSESVATFADGTTTVVADPRPSVSVTSLDGHGSISGSVTGIDEYRNLDTLSVQIDGETVATARPTRNGHPRFDFDRRRQVHFSHTDFTPGEQHSVTVVATDERGQTARVSRDVVPTKKPEVVRSEFVNDPVDSYHPRIDPKRYAAHHVFEIDLNGVDPKNVDVDLQGGDSPISRVETGDYMLTRTNSKNKVKIHSYWSGRFPREYYINAEWSVSQRNSRWEWAGSNTTKFKVTPSKPELRLNIVNDGTKEYITREHGILVDATGSFDPDGTNLKYIWRYGAEPTKPDNTTAKFSAYERAASIVEDQYDLRTKRNFDFLNYFVPDVSESTVLGEGPHYQNETVRVRVQTEPYHFSKQTYYRDFSLGISVSNPAANVVEWKTVEASNSRHSEPTEDAYRYVGIVEIPAEELSTASEGPTVTIYNEQNTRKKARTQIPEIGILVEDERYWSNVSVQDLTYLVEKHNVSKVQVNERERRDQYLEDGYHVEKVGNDTRYVLEKWTKVRDAKYEKVTKRFPDRRQRNMFLSSSPSWYRDGTVRKEETRTRKYSKWFDASTTPSPRRWFDSNLQNGERTGATRDVKVESAEYRTLRQYRYEYDVQRTGTRTETRCSLRFGCRDVTVTYTYTVTKSSTYWASYGYGAGHTFTGRTKRQKVEDAVYETQFEVRYQTQSTELVTYYNVARDEQVQPAQYEWRGKASTMNYVAARKQARTSDSWRIARETVKKWTLVRNESTSSFWTSVYSNESEVVKTKAVVAGEFTKQYYNSKTGELVKGTNYRSLELVYPTARQSEFIIEKLTKERGGSKWCEIKAACPKQKIYLLT